MGEYRGEEWSSLKTVVFNTRMIGDEEHSGWELKIEEKRGSYLWEEEKNTTWRRREDAQAKKKSTL